MITALSKDGINRLLIYHSAFLAVDKDDSFKIFIDNEHLKFTIQFIFSSEGDPFSTTYWQNVEDNFLKYQLNNWDSTTWVENSRPILLKVKDSTSKFWLKFRNYSLSTKDIRKFEISVWKEVSNG